jgi:hypothetical protein
MQLVWDYVERGLNLAGDGDSEARARLLLVRAFWGWGVTWRFEGLTRSSDERERDAAEAADMAARLGLADVESAALDALGAVAEDQRRYHRVSETIDRRIELLPHLRDPLERGDALCMAASSRFAMGAYAEASSLASLVYEEMELNQWSAVLHAMSWRAAARLLLAQWDDVLADLAAATTILRTGGLDEPPPFSCRIWTVAAFIHTARGRENDADRLLAMLPTTLDENMLISSSPAAALADVRRGKLSAALHRLTIIDAQVRAGDVLSCLARIDLAEVDHDWDGARRSIDNMLVTPESEGPPAPYGACAVELNGREALFRGDLTTAQAQLASALEAWSGLGALWPVARVELALGRALRDDDPAAASNHARRALDVFEPLGSLDEIERCQALLAG